MDILLAMKMAGLVVGAACLFTESLLPFFSSQCAIEDLNELNVNLVISRYLGG